MGFSHSAGSPMWGTNLEWGLNWSNSQRPEPVSGYSMSATAVPGFSLLICSSRVESCKEILFSLNQKVQSGFVSTEGFIKVVNWALVPTFLWFTSHCFSLQEFLLWIAICFFFFNREFCVAGFLLVHDLMPLCRKAVPLWRSVTASMCC